MKLLAAGMLSLLALPSIACGTPAPGSGADGSSSTSTDADGSSSTSSTATDADGSSSTSTDADGSSSTSTGVDELPVEVMSLELTWVDEERDDTASPNRGEKRAIMVSVRYPSSDGGATVAAPDGPLPVVLFSPGYCLNSADYTTIVDPLVERGHVVTTIDHPFISGSVQYPDGHVVGCDLSLTDDLVISLLGGDIMQATDRTLGLAKADPARFAGKLDENRVGILGHSIGAGAGVDVFLREKRFSALVMLDGDAADSPTYLPDTRPILLHFAGGHTLANDASLTRVWGDLSGPRFAVQVPSANHISYASDTSNPFIELVIAYDQAFFDAALGTGSYDTLLALPEMYPDGTLEHAGR